MLQPRPVESFPTISVDREYAALVTDFDVDAVEIAEYLRERGLNEEEISELTIHYSSTIKRKDGYPTATRTLGEYESAKKRIELFHPEVLFAYRAPLYTGSDQVVNINSDTLTSAMMNSTLIHEFEHYVDDVSGELDDASKAHAGERKKKLRKALFRTASAMVVGVVGITTTQAPLQSFVADTVEAHGGDLGWTGYAVSAATLAVYALGLRFGNKKMARDRMKIDAEFYQTAPIEMKAREAEQLYTRPFAHVSVKPENHEELVEIVHSSLTKVGGFDGTISPA